MKYKHPDFGTTSTILKLATQLIAKSVRPGESLRSIERKIERMIKFLEEKSGIVDMPPPQIGATLTEEDAKLFAPLLAPKHRKRREKARRIVPTKSR